MLECAGDVCLYTLVVCSEWLFVVAFSTRCNCCDSYFVSFNSTLPPGANHLRKALEDPLYKAKLTMQRKVKKNGKRMSSTQRFVPMVLQSTGGYCSNVSQICRQWTLELPSALRERLASPLDTMSSFLKVQVVMRGERDSM